MTTYVFRKGKIVDKSRAKPKFSADAATYVIGDEMASTQHMADRKFYTSKKKFRDATRKAGCVEYGNEIPTLLTPRKPIPLDRGKRRDDIRRTLYEMRNGRG